MHPILFQLGPVTIYTYGALVSISFVVCSLLVIKSAPEYGVDKEKVLDLLLVILISGVLGARLLHVALNLNYYTKNLPEIIMLNRGGLAIHGGIISAILAGAVFLMKTRQSFWRAGDLIMRYLPLGQAIGRIGCFFNGCCYGIGRHQTQLYSSAALITIFFILSWLSKRRRFDGQIFFMYFLLYCPARIAVDFFRGDLVSEAFGLTLSQIISGLLFLMALILYHCKRGAGRDDG